MINISPVGRNASNKERNEFEAYDKDAKIREKFVEVLKEKFGHLGLTYVVFSPFSFFFFFFFLLPDHNLLNPQD